MRLDEDRRTLANAIGEVQAQPTPIDPEVQQAATGSYRDFVDAIHPAVEGQPYQWQWYHELMADQLEAAAQADGGRLIVSIPPGHGKSELGSRLLPAYLLGRDPDHRIIAGSHGAELAREWGQSVRDVLACERYRQIFGARLPEAGSRLRDTMTHWRVPEGRGHYLSRGAGQRVSGYRADTIIIDDPHDAEEVRTSEAARKSVIGWWDAKLSTRLAGDDSSVIVIATRFHHRDLIGYLLEESGAGWEYLRIPALADGTGPSYDPRDAGEPLWPDRVGRERLERKREATPTVFATIWQQQPSAAGGTVIPEDNIETYSDLPDLDAGVCVQSWDLRYGGQGDDTSYAVGQLWWVPPGGTPLYLIDQCRGRWSFSETVEVVRAKAADSLWGRAEIRLVEDKADGRPLVDMLRQEIRGFIEVSPDGGKIQRLESVALRFASGEVVAPESASWIDEWVFEMTTYPQCARDDQVDATTQAIRWITRHLGALDARRHAPDSHDGSSSGGSTQSTRRHSTHSLDTGL